MLKVTGFVSGVYCARCKVNDKRYVGSSKNVKNRCYNHISDLRGGKHVNRHLQSAWNKYGEEEFEWTTLEWLPPDKMVLEGRENYWIACFRSADRRFGYNLCPASGSTLGLKLTQKQRAKTAEVTKRRWEDPAHRGKVTKSLNAIYDDPTFSKRRAKTLRRTLANPEHRKKVSEKMKTVCGSPEWKKQKSEAMKRKWQDPAHRARMKESMERSRDQKRLEQSKASGEKTLFD